MGKFTSEIQAAKRRHSRVYLRAKKIIRTDAKLRAKAAADEAGAFAEAMKRAEEQIAKEEKAGKPHDPTKAWDEAQGKS